MRVAGCDRIVPSDLKVYMAEICSNDDPPMQKKWFSSTCNTIKEEIKANTAIESEWYESKWSKAPVHISYHLVSMAFVVKRDYYIACV